MARYGFTGVKIPVEYGGQGGDSLAYVLMIEEFARVCPVLAIYANTPNSLGGGPLVMCGNEEQKKKYLPDIASGKKHIVFALTELPVPMPAARFPPLSRTEMISS